MIRINQIKVDISFDEKDMQSKILKILKINKNVLKSYRIVKKSIDARKNTVMYVYSVDVFTTEDNKIVKKLKNNNILLVEDKKYSALSNCKKRLNKRPVIVGLGPAGVFCGYVLALNGLQPLIIERGKDVESRIKEVNEFWINGNLNEECNVQFGEGGAGTFSDGKLNTLIKDVHGRGKFVLETLVKFGAPSEITYLNKPHIGTDKLSETVKNMRNEIIRLGGEVKFDTKMTDVNIEDNKVTYINVQSNGIDYKIDTDILVIAIGHSARDTFKMLYDRKFNMTRKAFAIGLRMEHLQETIQKKMYGDYGDKLPAADYKLTHKASNGRGVYSFCMCPGGYVVNASSEKNRLVVNGMSYSGRNGINANSAIVVTVNPTDFDGEHPLAGIEFQRKWEEEAYKIGCGKVPVQLFGDFNENTASTTLGGITPQIKGEYKLSNLNMVLPTYVSDTIKEGVMAFENKISGFSNPEAILSGVETRTSSPVRIERNDDGECYKGVYPCGEGAGYAGGITSAAIDGIKIAEKIIGN